MEQVKILTLGCSTAKKHWLITGSSGQYEDATYWNVATYTEKDYAEKARLHLQNKANKFNNALSPLERRAIMSELRESDPQAWSNGDIIYLLEEVQHVC